MATDPVTTTVTELPESRVRVEAEVPASRGLQARRAAARGWRSMRVPASARARRRRPS